MYITLQNKGDPCVYIDTHWPLSVYKAYGENEQESDFGHSPGFAYQTTFKDQETEVEIC